MVCENIFTVPPCPNGWRWGFKSYNRLDVSKIKEIQNLEGNKDHITGSRVTAIFLNGCTLPIALLVMLHREDDILSVLVSPTLCM